jgi:MOSC domain-containing protein YiiM
MTGTVTSVHRDDGHHFSKPPADAVTLLAGLGVEGDAHAGPTMPGPRGRGAVPNLRQVHLMHAELHDDLRAKGYDVGAGQLGENVTTRGLDLLGLPRGTLLHLGPAAVVEVTGLRDPCRQINRFRPGLVKEVLFRGADGTVVRRTGIMSVVRVGGVVRPGDGITVVLPDEPHVPLECV